MKIIISGSVNEIAALAVAMQGRQGKKRVTMNELFNHSTGADLSCLQFERPENQLNKEAIQSLISEGTQKQKHSD